MFGCKPVSVRASRTASAVTTLAIHANPTNIALEPVGRFCNVAPAKSSKTIIHDRMLLVGQRQGLLDRQARRDAQQGGLRLRPLGGVYDRLLDCLSLSPLLSMPRANKDTQ